MPTSIVYIALVVYQAWNINGIGSPYGILPLPADLCPPQILFGTYMTDDVTSMVIRNDTDEMHDVHFTLGRREEL